VTKKHGLLQVTVPFTVQLLRACTLGTVSSHFGSVVIIIYYSIISNYSESCDGSADLSPPFLKGFRAVLKGTIGMVP
jgi:hypothetical protein